MKMVQKRKATQYSILNDANNEDNKSENGSENATAEEPPQKKLLQANLYRPPTNEELQQLRETEYLFHSSLFRLQLTELLKEVTINEKKYMALTSYLNTLLKTLLSLQADDSECQLSDVSVWNSDVVLPIRCRFKHMKGTFKFLAPTSVKVTGSHLYKLNIKPSVHVDLSLEIPKACLHSKDYLNQRYLLKRALFLASIAERLKQHQHLFTSLTFLYHRGNRMMPILVVKPKVDGLHNISVRLHTCIADGIFKLQRFHIRRNNVRSKWFQSTAGDDDTLSDAVGQTDEDVATPVYNSLHLEDILRCQHADHINQVLKENTDVKDGIALLKVWLKQRELDEGYGAFNGFLLTMYVVYLLKNRKLSHSMSSYQIFRNTLLNLSQSAFDTDGISLADNVIIDNLKPTMSDFLERFDVVFVDFSGYLNLCAQMNVAVYKQLKHEATLAIRLLESSEADSFDVLLMKPVPFTLKYDQLFHVDHLENLQLCAVKQNLEHHLIDYNDDMTGLCMSTILKILAKALAQRVSLIGVRLQRVQEWNISDEPPSANEIVTFGLLLNEEHCYNVIERGPPADTIEAKAFRDFWGEVSEMRRFQDGSICEAVLWQSKTLADRRTICGRIIKHVLERHAVIPRSTITVMCSQLDTLIKLPQPHKKKHSLKYGTGEEQHISLVTAFDEFSRQLRNLKDLPLSLNTIQGVSPAFRYSEVFPPISERIVCHKGSNNNEFQHQWLSSLKVLCFPEISGSWPDEWQALRRTKALFYLQFGNLIRTQLKLKCFIYSDHILVYKAGYVFWLEIAYPKEIGAMKTVVTEDGMTKTVDNDAARELETSIIHLPKLSTHLSGLQKGHISYGAACRLAKRWLSAHLLLDGCFNVETVELLVAYLYTSPAPFTAPSMPHVAFMRFLNLLSRHDWQSSPLVVNFNNELKKDDLSGLLQQFTRDRSTLPLMCIITPMDHGGAMWTRKKPLPIILQRVIVLARESLLVLEKQLLDNDICTDFKHVFRPTFEAFDVVIHLNIHEVKRYYEAVDLDEDVTRPKFISNTSNELEIKQTLSSSDYDPVQKYLLELRMAFDDIALFFYDINGGDRVAVLWKPAAFQTHPFKISHINHSMVQASGSKNQNLELVLNKDAVLEDFKIMGEGLVTSIEIIDKQ